MFMHWTPDSSSTGVAGAKVRGRGHAASLMTIQKHEFYEGAALYQLIRGAGVSGVRYAAPFFVLNDEVQVYLKYSTGKRSPWSFTFGPEEQALLHARAARHRTFIGLICGADGVAALSFDNYTRIANVSDSALRIACFRLHREHFEVSGPGGKLPSKIPPSNWKRLVGEMQASGETL